MNKLNKMYASAVASVLLGAAGIIVTVEADEACRNLRTWPLIGAIPLWERCAAEANTPGEGSKPAGPGQVPPQTNTLPALGTTTLVPPEERPQPPVRDRRTEPVPEHRTATPLPEGTPTAHGTDPGAAPTAQESSSAAERESPPPRTVFTLRRDTEIAMAPTAAYCEDDLRRLPALRMELTSDVDLGGGTSIPTGTPVTVSIREKRSPTGAQPMFVKLEATAIHWDQGDVAVRTRQVPVHMERPSGTSRIVRGAALGSVAGAGIALVLKKNVLVGAAAGAVAGAGVGAAIASQDEACIAIDGTLLGFNVLRDVTLNQ